MRLMEVQQVGPWTRHFKRFDHYHERITKVVRMKYRCKMCGYEGEGASLPTTECPSCGMEGEWEANPFDARCPKCGQGYYESEKPNFCLNCGNRIAAPAPPVATTKAPAQPRRRRGGHRGASPTPTATVPVGGAVAPHLPADDFDLKKFLKVLACIVGIFLACWLGYYVVMWIWAALCFIARHWIISLIVLFFIIGAASKR